MRRRSAFILLFSHTAPAHSRYYRKVLTLLELPAALRPAYCLSDSVRSKVPATRGTEVEARIPVCREAVHACRD
jgi:hypothetical protein